MICGNLKCDEINKLILKYVNFELNKKDMARVALHLRNCPTCFQKYSNIQKRRKFLRKKMYKIEKTLRMQKEVSEYYDKEGSKD